MATSSATRNDPLSDPFKPGGEQAPVSGVTRSRSRSRSKVSGSRSRVSKRPSLPPTDEPSGSSRATSATRPSAIVIPGTQSQSFSSFGHAHGHGGSPATWGFGSQHGEQYSADGTPNHQQLFGQSFGGLGSLPAGASPSTHNGGSPPPTATDAAAKSVHFSHVYFFLIESVLY